MEPSSAFLLRDHRDNPGPTWFPFKRLREPIDLNLPQWDRAYEELLRHGFVEQVDPPVEIYAGVWRPRFRTTNLGERMCEVAMLMAVIRRPFVHGVARTGGALLAFISGYLLARAEDEQPIGWDAILWRARSILHPELAAETVMTLGQVLERVSGGDDERAFDLLTDAVRRAALEYGWPAVGRAP